MSYPSFTNKIVFDKIYIVSFSHTYMSRVNTPALNSVSFNAALQSVRDTRTMNTRRGLDKKRLKLDLSITTPRPLHGECPLYNRLDLLCTSVSDRISNVPDISLPPFFVALTSKSMCAMSSVVVPLKHGLKPLPLAFIPLFEAKLRKRCVEPPISIKVPKEWVKVKLNRGRDIPVRLNGLMYAATINAVVTSELVSAVTNEIAPLAGDSLSLDKCKYRMFLGETSQDFYLFGGFKFMDANVKVKSVVIIDTESFIEYIRNRQSTTADSSQFATEIATIS